MESMARSSGERFRMDVARWIRPQEVADLAEVRPLGALKLLFRHPPLRAMAWCRFGEWASRRGIRGVAGYVQRRLLFRFGLEIKPGGDIGGGLYIAHPVGCTLFADHIGENVTVIADVTFGTRTDARWPIIEDEAFIGAGARILGGIRVGAQAQIGANAVVVRDVEAKSTVVGVPAHPIGG
jgi:serine O-acetyltransferase